MLSAPPFETDVVKPRRAATAFRAVGVRASLLPARPQLPDGRAGVVWPAGWPARTDNGETTMVIGQALDEVWHKATQQHTRPTQHNTHTHRHLWAVQWAR